MRLTIGDASIHYVEAGDTSASPVVLIHGFPFDHQMWEPQLEFLRESHRVVAYDLRGHGESSIGDGLYTIEGHVDDLLAMLDRLEIEQATLVGLSMGGYIALRFMERSPERVRALVLCDTRSEADDNAGKIKRATGMASVKATGSKAFAEGFLPAVFAPKTLAEQNDLVDRVRQTIARTPELSIAGTLLALAGRTDTTASLASIRVPTLILVGEHDSVTPPATSRAMAERIRGAELHQVPEAGHLSNLENPRFFNARLGEFLERVG